MNVSPAKKGILIGCLAFAASSASATPILLGYITDGQPPSEANERAWVEHLVQASLNSVTSADITGDHVHTYTRNSSVDPGSGVIPLGTKSLDGDLTVDPGSEYVSGKYGNLGLVVWYTGGESFTLPGTWTLATGIVDNGGGLSHHTTFGSFSVPEGGSTIALFGFGFAVLGLIRNKIRALA